MVQSGKSEPMYISILESKKSEKMKNKKVIKLGRAFVFGLVLTFALGCERDLSDDVVDATFSKTAEVFIDTPVGMGTDFYFPFEGSKEEAATFDGEGYESTASVRVDVPNPNDPAGNYAGAIFRVDGVGRDLSSFDALTFWAKASRGVNLDQVGFGLDFVEDKYRVTKENLTVGTNWAKYIIPIPDASRLIEERGMFWYSSGTDLNSDNAYVIWFDDIKFESLGTIAQPRPLISDGFDLSVDTFIGASATVTGTEEIFNLGSGLEFTIQVAPSFYEFTSSNPEVATVNENGSINVLVSGTSVITATLNGLAAEGSLTVNAIGQFPFAPTPTRDPNNVTSVFSDVYTNINVDFFNGFWEPFQTTLSADFSVDGDDILNYTNFNFVGNQFGNPTVDATEQSNLHIDMYIPGEIPSLFDFLITVRDFGADGADGGGDDSFQQIFVNASNFDIEANTWISLDLPITMAQRDHIGLIIYENINFATLRNFYLDNIYFYSN
jgi:hypothetical protein